MISLRIKPRIKMKKLIICLRVRFRVWMRRLVILRSIIWLKWMFLGKRILFSRIKLPLRLHIKSNKYSWMDRKVIYTKKLDMVINGKLQDKDKTDINQEEMTCHRISDFLDKSPLLLDKRTTITTCHLAAPPSLGRMKIVMTTSIFHHTQTILINNSETQETSDLVLTISSSPTLEAVD